MSDKVKAVEFVAELRQVKTMADGSVNVTVNLPEQCIKQAQVLIGWVNLTVKSVMVLDDENGDFENRGKIHI